LLNFVAANPQLTEWVYPLFQTKSRGSLRWFAKPDFEIYYTENMAPVVIVVES